MPKDFDIYIVKQGDTIDKIALKFSIEVNQIIYDNQLPYPYKLAIGQALFIDFGSRNPTRNLRIFGYAYPFISEWVLTQTLPYLSELPIFSYGFTVSGELVPPIIPEDRMIYIAKEYGTLPILTLTPLDENGNFSNILIHNVINSKNATDTLISNLLTTMTNKGYAGIDIDFEYILPEDRDEFTDFVAKLSNTMHNNGYHTSIALAPKTSSEQKGLLYEGKDYKALANLVDHALIMTYEWGYTYGPPLAIAPIHQVRRVVEYAVTEIIPSKIDLGIPNYGYDWPLPYVRGETAATTIGNVQAVQIAIAQGVPIEFDELSQSPHFNYEAEGVLHEVWFEDVRSIRSKLDLINQYQLGGCGYWQIMRWWRANWKLLSKFFYTDK